MDLLNRQSAAFKAYNDALVKYRTATSMVEMNSAFQGLASAKANLDAIGEEMKQSQSKFQKFLGSDPALEALYAKFRNNLSMEDAIAIMGPEMRELAKTTGTNLEDFVKVRKTEAKKGVEKVCASCGTTEKLRRCGGCEAVWYCSRECQRAHFKFHREVCG